MPKRQKIPVMLKALQVSMEHHEQIRCIEAEIRLLCVMRNLTIQDCRDSIASREEFACLYAISVIRVQRTIMRLARGLKTLRGSLQTPRRAA